MIAETTDLPTKFAKVVVTDDQGRYVLPALPKATYSVWVRGYGLVDSPKVRSEPGKILNLSATPAPNAAAAAEYYPGVYWYSMLKIPPKSDFPGTGPQGNGIPAVMKSQHFWIDTIKNSCQSCHALGSAGVRHIPEGLGTFKDSKEAWIRRVQSGQAMLNMALTLERLGPDKGIDLFADWTDRIAKGELPFAKPERPKGLERNMVVSIWDWSTRRPTCADAVSPTSATGPSMRMAKFTDRRGARWCRCSIRSPTPSSIKHPFVDPRPSCSTCPRRPRPIGATS